MDTLSIRGKGEEKVSLAPAHSIMAEIPMG